MQRPRLKIVRRLGTQLPGLTRKETRWKTYPPGAHGPAQRRRASGYGARLQEKQKLRWHYGISERQLQAVFEQASGQAGATGELLLALLERRLDSVVFRLGYAPTIPAARQLVSHGHVYVNGGRVDRPSYRVTRGEEITLGERARRMPDVQVAVARGPEVRLPGWLALDPDDACRGRIIGDPVRADVPFVVDEVAIVEFYAR